MQASLSVPFLSEANVRQRAEPEAELEKQRDDKVGGWGCVCVVGRGGGRCSWGHCRFSLIERRSSLCHTYSLVQESFPIAEISLFK